MKNTYPKVEEETSLVDKIGVGVLLCLMLLGLIYFIFYTIPAAWQWIDDNVVTQEELDNETYTTKRQLQALAQEVCDLKLSKEKETTRSGVITLSSRGYVQCL